MAGRLETRVIHLTPPSRMESIIHVLGLVIEVTGWFIAAAAAIQGLGTAFTVALAVIVVVLGRKLRGR